MGNTKILCFFSIIIICLTKDCGQGQLSEEELINLSVDCFNEKYNPDIHDGHKLTRIIDNRVGAYKKILQHIKMHKKKHIETSPVVKWAQTKQKIFVNFKLSHRQDSPPCSDVRNENFKIENVENIQGKFYIEKLTNDTNLSRIDFRSECFFTDQKFLFKLTMVFNASLKSMSIDREGFGTYTIVGQKRQAQIWIDPFEDVHRAAIWQQMRERYDKDMDQYFEMREKRFEQNQSKSKRKRKKRPTNSSQTKQIEAPLSKQVPQQL